MMVIKPKALAIVSSNVPETDAPEWSSVAQYAAGTQAMIGSLHQVYEATAASTNAYPPDNCTGDTAKWRLIGATNKYKMLDEFVGTATTRDQELIVEFDATSCNAFALFNVTGRTILAELVQAGQVVWSQEFSCLQPVYSYTDWFFGQRIFVRHFWSMMPLRVGVTLRVTVTGDGTCGIGNVVLGLREILGGTQWDISIALLPYSKVETNGFGLTYIAKGKIARRANVIVSVENDMISHVLNRLSALDAVACAWICNNANGWEPEATLLYGILKNAEMNIPGPILSSLRAEFQGLI